MRDTVEGHPYWGCILQRGPDLGGVGGEADSSWKICSPTFPETVQVLGCLMSDLFSGDSLTAKIRFTSLVYIKTIAAMLERDEKDERPGLTANLYSMQPALCVEICWLPFNTSTVEPC